MIFALCLAALSWGMGGQSSGCVTRASLRLWGLNCISCPSAEGSNPLSSNQLRKKPCKYFEQGKGTCPFGGKCLYLHAYPDGTRAEPEKPRKQLSSEGTVRFFNSVRLWDFIEDRESRSAPGGDDEVTELGELFMHLSGAEEDPTAAQ